MSSEAGEWTTTQIVARMAEAYHTCASYADTGRYHEANTRGTFTTAFVRPDRFRFSYREYWHEDLNTRFLVTWDGRTSDGTDQVAAEFRE
jgi:hypothetical protein